MSRSGLDRAGPFGHPCDKGREIVRRPALGRDQIDAVVSRFCTASVFTAAKARALYGGNYCSPTIHRIADLHCAATGNLRRYQGATRAGQCPLLVEADSTRTSDFRPVLTDSVEKSVGAADLIFPAPWARFSNKDAGDRAAWRPRDVDRSK
jgi:hypothetical protein